MSVCKHHGCGILLAVPVDSLPTQLGNVKVHSPTAFAVPSPAAGGPQTGLFTWGSLGSFHRSKVLLSWDP